MICQWCQHSVLLPLHLHVHAHNIHTHTLHTHTTHTHTCTHTHMHTHTTHTHTRDVSGSSTRVPSNMVSCADRPTSPSYHCTFTPLPVQPYDLQPFAPGYSPGIANVPLSQTGLVQWRAVLGMLVNPTATQGTQLLPPPCHPTADLLTRRLLDASTSNQYAVDEHKRDLDLRSCFLRSDSAVVRTPLLAPPTPREVTAWYHKIVMMDRLGGIESEAPPINEKAIQKEKYHGLNEGSTTGRTSLSPVMEFTTPVRSQRDQSNAASAHVRPREDTALNVPPLQGNPSTLEVRLEEARQSSPATSASTRLPPSTLKLPMHTRSKQVVGQDEGEPFAPLTQQRGKDTSQLEGPTPDNSYGFKINQSALPDQAICDSHEVYVHVCVHKYPSILLMSRFRSILPYPDSIPYTLLHPHSVPGAVPDLNEPGASCT